MPADHLAPELALVLVALTLLVSVGMFVWALTWTLLPWLKVRRDRRRTRDRLPSRAGPAVLTGTVLKGATVRLDSTQSGRELEDSGQWVQEWLETERHLTISPFQLSLASGERIRVEPEQDTEIVGDFNQTTKIDGTTRTRTLEIGAGMRIWVVGDAVWPEEAKEGYRTAASEPVLRRPLRTPMRILLEEPSLTRAIRFDRWIYHTFVALWVVFAAQASMVPYCLRLLHGETVVGTVIDLTRHKGERTIHQASVLLPNREVVTEDVDQELFDRLDKGNRMAIRRPRGLPWMEQVGAKPSLSWDRMTGTLFSLCGLVVVYMLGRFIPWNRGARLTERVDGQLPPKDDTA